MSPLSNAEHKAEEATKLEAFPLQLFDVRRTVKEVLDLFGRNNIFSEYTVHNFSHVEAMLADLEWLIPAPTKKAMTPADWLMITLGIYFHDLGLVVTEDEYKRRNDTDFPTFCKTVLFAKSDGQDYKSKVETLGEDLADRFFYQEFVRANHAKRVRAWIEGSPSEDMGFADAQRKEIDDLFHRLDSDFRRDLATVCESHNLDDLDNLSKYKPFQPYGRTNSEAANLLYVAAILRTVDLVQITKQRAPSMMFRMISPTDPISQAEWAKQNGVKGIFPKEAIDKDGKPTESDTISVYAKFDNENGFFGLTSYLAYAAKQLAYTYSCVQKANANTAKKLEFPWRKIDDSNVEAVGFIPTPFEFQIDQAKILDLLTGHTLYNDSSVAIRELVQNAIDAVRLQHGPDCESKGYIAVAWDSENRTLTIRDNGTGMTQEIIERHLLNVGSSRYQDPKFKEKYPDFSPISRFGIGVLSTFMVADTVQIVTFHGEEERGRLISLRSVHGKYLIRLVDKASSEEARIRGGPVFRDRMAAWLRWILGLITPPISPALGR
jgi:molecular chaperone HtpG